VAEHLELDAVLIELLPDGLERVFGNRTLGAPAPDSADSDMSSTSFSPSFTIALMISSTSDVTWRKL
jgi:hypothetical protein